jgi:hypothetical protein
MNLTEEQIKEYELYRSKLIGDIAESISDYIIQLFYDDKKKDPKATGCGTLLEIDNRCFLITAAHVIAEHPDTTYAAIGNDGVFLGGLMHFIALPASTKRQDDKIDLAFIELEQVTANKIKQQHKFLTLNDLQIGYIPTENSQYLLYGYPGTKTKSKKLKNEDLIVAKPFIYNSKLHTIFSYEKFGFKSFSHIAINFTGEVLTNVNKNPHYAPDLGGMSGSGLWYLPDFPFPSVITNRKLIGIVIERINELDNKAVISTSIDIVTETLRDKLNITVIPKSLKVNVNSNIL